jgi:uncharacterized membrane protein YdjX (TVP38/TMEM64 family)
MAPAPSGRQRRGAGGRLPGPSSTGRVHSVTAADLTVPNSQVLVAPTPGQVTGLVGGYLFGPLWGLVYTIVGATIGFTLVLVLARKLGQPFVERLVSAKALERFDYLAQGRGVVVLFLIFLLPAFPDDVVSLVAGSPASGSARWCWCRWRAACLATPC